MKNGCNKDFEAKVEDRSERAKKLYRYVSDVARQIDEKTSGYHSISDLFSTRIEVQRQKLRDNCEKLLFLDPLNHGKKALELLWRKVYYETVSAAKKLKQTDNDYDSYVFTHILCGIGHIHNLIERIQSEMNVQLKELDYIPLHDDEETDNMRVGVSDDDLQFGRSTIHSCLIYLGDLSRYQSEMFHTFETSIAARYYLQAAHIDLSSGMPYNQLGNLYLDKNYNLDSVCYYIHCLSCMTPFEGAIGNITKIFEKFAQYCESPLNEAESQVEHIQSTVGNFLSLIEIWYFNKTDTNIPQRLNTIIHQLKIAMDFNKTLLPDINKNYTEHIQAVDEETVTPSYLNSNLIHKIIQICLFTLAKINETDEQKAFACKAFTLAIFSQLLQKQLKQLTILGLKSPAYKYQSRVIPPQKIKTLEKQSKPVIETIVTTPLANGDEETNGDFNPKEDVCDKDNKKQQNGETKMNNKKTLSKRRRRRRIASSESSDVSDEETESSEVGTDESCSEDDVSDYSCESENESLSEDSNHDRAETEIINGKGELNGSATKEGGLTVESDIINNEVIKNAKEINLSEEEDSQKKTENEIDVEELQNFLYGDNILPSIKLLHDWILTEKELILSCGDSGEPLLQSVVDLLNIYTHYFSSTSNETLLKDNKILEYVRFASKKLLLEHKTIPLPEDVNLRGTNICKFDKDAAEWQILEKYKPNVYEENVIRILNFIDFGNQLANIVPRIRFNRSLKIFFLKKISTPKLNTKIDHKRSREWQNSKKQYPESGEAVGGGGGGGGGGAGGGLLRRLGRLWLVSQVRELERMERSGRAAPPAFLALDAAALHAHLRRVKQLLRARNFILLVPAVVLQELDDLKRDRSSARDAIRWLELQLKNGSRFVRTQRPGQAKPLPLLKYPRKAPPHVHNFIQILEFCNHFIADDRQNQGGDGDPDGSSTGKTAPLLILLVGNEPGTEENPYKEFSTMGAAQAAGISVEYIGDFYARWRHSVPKTGKKR